MGIGDVFFRIYHTNDNQKKRHLLYYPYSMFYCINGTLCSPYDKFS
jgi:hypothetical protein